MNVDQEDIKEIQDLLIVLLDDFPAKTKDEMSLVINSLEKANDTSEILKIMDDLEIMSNSSNLNNFARNEIINIIASLDGIVNN